MAIMVLAMVLPIAWMVVLSVQPDRNIISATWDFSVVGSHFATLLSPQSAAPSQLANSIIIVIGTVILCLTVSALAGYALSRLRLARTATLLLLGVAGFLPLVPPMTLVPGLYVTLANFGLLGTLQGLILLNTLFNLPFAVLLMKVYFDPVPRDLREAGLVDGASEFNVFWAIMLPLVRPGLAAVGVFTGIMAWNEFLMGLTMTSGGRTSPLTVGIASLVQPNQMVWGDLAAVGTLAAVPIIVLGILANRQIVAGMTGGAVKG